MQPRQKTNEDEGRTEYNTIVYMPELPPHEDHWAVGWRIYYLIRTVGWWGGYL